MRTAHLLSVLALTAAIAPAALAQRNDRHDRPGTNEDVEKIVMDRLVGGKVISVTFGNIERDPNIGAEAKYFIHVLSDGKNPEDTSVLSFTSTDKTFFDKCKNIAAGILKKDQISPFALRAFNLALKTMYPTVNGVTQKPDETGQGWINRHWRMKTSTHQLFYIPNAAKLTGMVPGGNSAPRREM